MKLRALFVLIAIVAAYLSFVTRDFYGDVDRLKTAVIEDRGTLSVQGCSQARRVWFETKYEAAIDSAGFVFFKTAQERREVFRLFDQQPELFPDPSKEGYGSEMEAFAAVIKKLVSSALRQQSR